MPPVSQQKELGPWLGLCCVMAISVQQSACPQHQNLDEPANSHAVRLELEIDGRNHADQLLTTVTDLVASPTGAIYVTAPLEKTIRVFGPQGAFLHNIGKAGAGPGEFQDPWLLGWKSDTLWITDRGLGRISLFSSDGDFIRIVSQVRVRVSAGTWIAPEALLGDGSVLARSGSTRPGESDSIPNVPLVRTTRRGEVLDTVFYHSQYGRLLSIENSSSKLLAPHPFSDAPLYHLAPEGDWLVVLNRRVTSHSRPHYSLVRLDVTGDTVFAKKIPYQPVTLSAETIDAWIADFLGKLAGRGSQSARSIREALHAPAYWPPVDQLVVGTDGSIWCRERTEERTHSRWRVLDSQGTTEAMVRMPLGFELLYTDGVRLWGVVYDELGVPTVQRYALAKTDPS